MNTLDSLLQAMDRVVYGNSLREWIFSVSVTILLFFFFQLLRRVLRKRLFRDTKGAVDWQKIGDYVLRSTRQSFLFVLSLWLGSRFLTLSPGVSGLFEKLLVLCFLFQAAVWANFVINYLIESYAERGVNGDADKAGTLRAASGLVKLVVWVALLLFALDNMGVNVTTLIAGLGIGGVAIGLASQKILSDLFSSITILLDKPFVLGDFVTVGGDSGTIERIGLKTTRVRSTTGEELAFPNSDLLQSRIRNFRRMRERRCQLTFGVAYATKQESLQKIPAMVRDIVDSQKQARFDRAHLKNLGNSSLDFEAIYWINSPDYKVFMDVQQAVNLELLKRFAEAKIEFSSAVPTVMIKG